MNDTNIDGVFYEKENINREVIIIFKEVPIIEDESLFSRSHYFRDKENKSITPLFKDELLKLFDVADVNELKEKIDNKIRLMFKVGTGKMCYDGQTNTVIVYMESFKNEIVKPAEEIRKVKNSVEKLMKNQEISSKEMFKIVSAITKGIENVKILEKHKNEIAKLIPGLIKKGKIKISLKDITDINKERLKDIVKLGRDLINKKIGVEKRLGISREHIGKEYAWQKYFELYGSYLLFGSIEEKLPETTIKIQSELRNKDSRLDFLTINRYGFLDIIELKRSDEYLFKIDSSHDNIVPTAKLSTAISQVNNYLMILPYDEEKGDLIKGAESSTGMLVFGTTQTLMKKEDIDRYLSKTGMTIEKFNLKVRKTLRELNYSYSHIQIVLYDELLDNLENFLNQMDIEINI